MCIEQARHISCVAIIKILLIPRRQVSYKWSEHITLISNLQWVVALSQTWLISEAVGQGLHVGPPGQSKVVNWIGK